MNRPQAQEMSIQYQMIGAVPILKASAQFMLHLPTFLLKPMDRALQGFESEHSRHGRGYSSDHIGTHSVVESPPTFFLQYDLTGPNHTLVSRTVDQAIGI